MDSGFKRLYYVKYADNWVLFVCGSYVDATRIRDLVSDKLKSFGLSLNLDKSVITHLRKKRGKFLGFEFFIRKTTNDNIKPIRTVTQVGSSITRRFPLRLILHAPISDLLDRLVKESFIRRDHLGKNNCVPLTHHRILQFFNGKDRGLLNYFLCAHNRMRLWSIVRFMKYSCALILARKFKLKSLAKVFKKFGPSLKFTASNGKKHKFFIPDNLRILPMNLRFNSKMG